MRIYTHNISSISVNITYITYIYICLPEACLDIPIGYSPMNISTTPQSHNIIRFSGEIYVIIQAYWQWSIRCFFFFCLVVFLLSYSFKHTLIIILGSMSRNAQGRCHFCCKKHTVPVFGSDEVAHTLLQKLNLRLVVSSYNIT